MKLMQKGNKQIRVEDAQAERLLKEGYMELDQKTGKPIALPKRDLKEENAALKRENKALKERVAALTAELDSLKSGS